MPPEKALEFERIWLHGGDGAQGRGSILRSRLLLAASVMLASFPMGLVAYRLFGANLTSYLPLAPLATLFFFGRERTGPAHQSLSRLLLLVPGTAFVMAGLYLGRPSLLWIGSYWNTLAVCALGGFVFAFPAPLLIFAVPPLASFVSIIAGFSLRIWLSDVAALLLQFLDPHAGAVGNLISFRGEAFAVDRVCEGMKMATASSLLAMVLARFSSWNGRWLILLGIFPLWLAANLFRIVSLILFRLPAGSSGHELVGLALFAGMVVFPLMIASLAFPAKPAAPRAIKPPQGVLATPILHRASLAILALLSLSSVLLPRNPQSPATWPASHQGFVRETGGSEPSVAIFHRGDDSIILKRHLFAPGTAHDPRICFEAAGFTFRDETEEVIGSFRVRSARVEKSGKPARLFWWYAWDGERSASDVDWRLARLRGHEVVQVNLYGGDDAALRATALQLLTQGGR